MVIRPLDRKLFRDLAYMKAQILTISLVVAVGIANLVGFRSTYESLNAAQRDFYAESNFGDAFASLKRAPLSVLRRLEAVPGVSLVEDRLVFEALMDVRGVPEPAVGRFVSIPETGESGLNRLRLLSGRLPRAGDSDEVVAGEAFCEANLVGAGSSLAVTLNGIRRTLRIVGVGTSPEYVFAVPGAAPLPDDRHFGVFWMRREALAAAYDMAGSFNNVSFRFSQDASEPEALRGIDDVLRTWGGIGAIGRKDQSSNRFLTEEMRSLRVQATILPVIFLLVAAYLLNVVLSRVIHTQRDQIATLKAIGYADRDIAFHFLKMSVVIVLLGAALGILFGIQVGEYFTGIYTHFYRFPSLRYQFSPVHLITGIVVSFATAFWGVVSGLRGIFRLTPAEAMRPPAPPNYHESALEKSGLLERLTLHARMVLRGLVMRPWGTFLTLLGMAFAMMILIAGRFWQDSIDRLLLVQFSLVQKETALVSFREPVLNDAVLEIGKLRGVLQAEGYRMIPIRIYAGHRMRNSVLMGLPERPKLRGVTDADLRNIEIPEEGVLISRSLARVLGIRVGDTLRLRVLEGREPEREVRVERIIDTFVSAELYTSVRAANELMREGPLRNFVALRAETRRSPELYGELRKRPDVTTILFRDTALESFQKTTAQFTLVISFVLLLFASVITVGVVYNNARVALSERDWELATLRILGFRHGEVFRILFGEIGVLLLAAIPFGWIMGYLLSRSLIEQISHETMQFPFVIYPKTFAVGAIVFSLSGALSAWLISRRLRKLDFIETLKSRG